MLECVAALDGSFRILGVQGGSGADFTSILAGSGGRAAARTRLRPLVRHLGEIAQGRRVILLQGDARSAPTRPADFFSVAQRFRAFWWRALGWGLFVGVPVSAWHAWGMWRQASDPWRHATLLEAFPADFAPALSVAYLAAAVLAADSAIGSRILSWFVPAGRLSLSNYLAQSVLMGVMLSGFGLGWGATLTQSGLLLVAVAIYLVLLLASHVMTRLGATSPLEEAWRR